MSSPPLLSQELKAQATTLFNRAESKKSEMMSKEQQYKDAWDRYNRAEEDWENLYIEHNEFIDGLKEELDVLTKAQGNILVGNNMVSARVLTDMLEEFITVYTERRRDLEREEGAIDHYGTKLETLAREVASAHKDYIRSALDYYALIFQADRVLLDAVNRMKAEE